MMGKKANNVEAYEGASPYMFISYSHKDKERVLPILARLEQEGYRFWYDQGIHGGDTWAAVIADHVQQCSALVLFVTSNSMASEDCFNELAYAKNNKKPVIMVVLEQNVHIPAEIDMNTSRFQRLFMNKPFDLDELLYELHMSPILNSCHGEGKGVRPASVPTKSVPKQKAFDVKMVWIALLFVVVVVVAVVAVARGIGKPQSVADVDKDTSISTTTTIRQEPSQEQQTEIVPTTASLKDLVSIKQNYTFTQTPAYDVFGTLHAEYYDFGLDWVTNEAESAWILNKEYTTFSCEITFLEDVATAENLSVSFYADDRLVHFEPDFSNQSRVRTVSFDVSGAQKLTIKSGYEGSGFSDPYCNFIIVNDKLEK